MRGIDKFCVKLKYIILLVGLKLSTLRNFKVLKGAKEMSARIQDFFVSKTFIFGYKMSA